MDLIEPKPRWEPLYLHCGACGTDWQDWQPLWVRVNVWLACMDGLRCPSCAVGAVRLTVLPGPGDGGKAA